MRPVVPAAAGFAAGLACAALVAWLLADRTSGALPVNTQRRPSEMSEVSRSELPLPRSEAVPGPPARSLVANPPGAALAPQPAAMPDGILIYGSVLDEARQPINQEMAQVQFVPASGETIWVYIESGTYSHMGLTPGEWTVLTELKHYKPTSQPLTLSADQPFVRLDLVVGASHRVVVRAFAPDGRPIDAALADTKDSADLWSSLGVIASLAPSAGAPELRQEQWTDWGIGRFWLRGGIGAYFDQVSMPDDCLGVLELSVASAAWAHLMFGSALLASQPVPADATEIAFTLNPAQLAQSLGSLVVRCVDAESHKPLADAWIQLRTPDAWGEPETAGSDGRWRRERITPGSYLFTANTKTSEHLTLEVAIPSGGTLDLGDVEIGGARRLTGSVVTADGQGVATNLRVRCLDQQGRLPIAVEDGYVQTDPQGAFEMSGLGPRRYVLSVVDDEHARHAVAADLSASDVTGMRIVVSVGVRVTVHPDWPAQQSRDVRILDRNGFTMGEGPGLKGDKTFVRRLEPGGYTVVVTDADGAERRKSFGVSDKDTDVLLGPESSR